VRELLHDPAKLQVLRFRVIGNQSDQAQRLALGLGESGGLVQCRIVEKIDTALGDA
jgi:hypothetical protein